MRTESGRVSRKRVLFYGVTDSYGDALFGDVVEWFATSAEAEQFIAEVRDGEPDLTAGLEVVAVEFETAANRNKTG